MRKLFTVLSFILTVVIFQFLGTHEAISYTAGSPAGRTGSPGDNNRTCAQSSCHTGTPSGGSVTINTDVPSSGYIPGQQYNVDVTVMQTGISKFGFTITSENSGHDRVGSFIGTTNVQTISGNSYATHRSGSTSGSDSKTWSFSWTAPTSGTGDVTFYAAGNAANNNNNRSGDAIYTSSISVTEDLASGISSFEELGIMIYPNPVENDLWIEGLVSNSPVSLTIFDLNGRKIWSDELVQSSADRQKLELSTLESGIYILTLYLEGQISHQKFVVSK